MYVKCNYYYEWVFVKYFYGKLYPKNIFPKNNCISITRPDITLKEKDLNPKDIISFKEWCKKVNIKYPFDNYGKVKCVWSNANSSYKVGEIISVEDYGPRFTHNLDVNEELVSKNKYFVPYFGEIKGEALKESKPKFEVGKWYRLGKWISKFKRVKCDYQFWGENISTKSGFHDKEGFLNLDNYTPELITNLKEIQQYLPEGHPDKIEFVLPDKWCIRCTKENVGILGDWRPQGKVGIFSIDIPHGYMKQDGIWIPEINYKDIIITFEQFKKYVLKENTNEMKLKTNTWYQNQYDKRWYVYRTGDINNVGFDHGDWTTHNPCDKIDGEWKEAPREDVEKLLINEAKKRYVLGETIIDKEDPYQLNSSPIQISKEDEDPFGIRGGGAKLYANGKWAEVIETPKKVNNEYPFKIGDLIVVQNIEKYNKDYKRYNGDLLKVDNIKQDNYHNYWVTHTPNSFSGGGFGYKSYENYVRLSTPYEVKLYNQGYTNINTPKEVVKSHPNNIEDFEIGEELYLIKNKDMVAEIGAKCKVVNNTRHYLDIKWLDNKSNIQMNGSYNYDQFSRINPLKEVVKEEFKVGDFVITKGYSSNYDGRLLEITKIIDKKFCYFKVYDGKYYYTNDNFSKEYILRKATQDEINRVLQKTNQHSKGEAMDFFVVNVDGVPKSIVNMQRGLYNIPESQPIQLKKVKAIINKVKKY